MDDVSRCKWLNCRDIRKLVKALIPRILENYLFLWQMPAGLLLAGNFDQNTYIAEIILFNLFLVIYSQGLTL